MPAAPTDDAPAALVAEGVWRVALPSMPLPPFEHTNAYVVARSGVGLVIDPGSREPVAAERLQATLRAAGVAAPKGIVLTHTHSDHVAGVPALRDAYPDVAVYVHPLELARVPSEWRATGLAGGRRLTVADAVVEVVHTPGHSPGHVTLWWPPGRTAIVGDLVAGAGSVWVGVPDGDVSHYLESLARVAALDPRVVAPGHGPVRRDGAAVLLEARTHRMERERQVLAALRAGPRGVRELREAIYPELDPAVAPFAERSLLAHLHKLMRERRVMHAGTDEQGPYLLATSEAADDG